MRCWRLLVIRHSFSSLNSFSKEFPRQDGPAIPKKKRLDSSSEEASSKELRCSGHRCKRQRARHGGLQTLASIIQRIRQTPTGVGACANSQVLKRVGVQLTYEG